MEKTENKIKTNKFKKQKQFILCVNQNKQMFKTKKKQNKRKFVFFV